MGSGWTRCIGEFGVRRVGRLEPRDAPAFAGATGLGRAFF